MALTDKQILTYLNVRGLGIKTAFKLAEYARENSVVLENQNDMYEFCSTLLSKKIIKRPKFENANAILDGYDIAMRILESSANSGIKYASYYSENFPSKLKDIRDSKGELDAPLFLWYKGDLTVAEMPSVAIIGTREPTPEGIKVGNYLGQRFAEAGFNIVSGLAYGCDKSGHEGALRALNGKTTAFLAHGLDIIYPPEHTELAHRIVEAGGLLLSEYSIGTRGMANYFIARDRLQSGLADACIVIQTGRSGGTLHAVKATIANKKPLYAVKFSNTEIIGLPKVQGNVMLLDEGIKVADNSQAQKALPITSDKCEEIIEKLKNSTKIGEQNLPNEKHSIYQQQLALF